MTDIRSPLPPLVRGGSTRPQVQTPALVSTTQSQAAQQVVVTQHSPVAERDLDAFLLARAQVKGAASLPASLQALLGAPARGAAKIVQHGLSTAVQELQAIYADGRVTEDERMALQRVHSRFEAIAALADPDVANMLPRDVRERLQQQLFGPVQTLLDATAVQQRALFDGIVVRDEASLRARLSEPVNFAARGSTSWAVGDRVMIRRSHGGLSEGVLHSEQPNQHWSVAFVDNGQFALKDIAITTLQHENAYKIGDHWSHNDCDVWVEGCDANGPRLVIEQENAVVLRGGVDLLLHVAARSELEKRQERPLETRTVDMGLMKRAGVSLDDPKRFDVDSFVCVPRSDGSHSRGVLREMTRVGALVEMNIPDAQGRPQTATKMLPFDIFRGANPAKLGDVIALAAGKLTITSVGVDGLHGVLDNDGKQTHLGHADITEMMSHQSLAAGPSVPPSLPPSLPSSVRAQVEALMVLADDPVFGTLSHSVRKRVDDPRWRAQSPDQQELQLRALFAQPRQLHDVVPNFGAVRRNLSHVDVSPSVRAPGAVFKTAKGNSAPDAEVTTLIVRVGTAKRAVVLTLPMSMSDKERARLRDDVSLALRQLPPEALRGIKSVVVNPGRNPHDEEFAKMFNMPDFKSAMTADEDTRQLTIYPPTSIVTAVQSFTHEVGHFASIDAFGSIHARANTKWDAWTAAASSDGVAVSQYAMKAGHEDFAETFALYMTTKGTDQHAWYRALMPQRFAILDRLGAP